MLGIVVAKSLELVTSNFHFFAFQYHPNKNPMKKTIPLLLLAFVLLSCETEKMETKGFQVSEFTEDESGQKVVGLEIDSLQLETRPRGVLLTKHPQHRLTPIYKVSYHKKTKKPFTGTNAYHTNWDEDYGPGNNWNHNFMPGFEAMYGYNLVNVSHFNHETKTENRFFERPVLIKTLYYPAFSQDTLNGQEVHRTFYMVSAYDEDTNEDGFINGKDLRRFYHFDLQGQSKKALIPLDYSVMNSEYDSANDLMYVFARKDTNQNGQMELEEPTDIFWIDLKNPENVGIQFETKR
jgi:curved DNA-binding protein CbpA